MGQVFIVNSLGGYAHADNLSDLFRESLQPECKFRQFCDVKDASHQGKHKGQTFHWDVINDVATQGTTLVETTTMPETQFTITQGTMTIVEGGNSVPYSFMLDCLSDKPFRPIVTKALKNDAKKFFDNQAYAQFNATLLRAAPTSSTSTDAITLTTNGTITLTASVALNKGHVKAIADAMKERSIPAYEKDDYFCISWPTTLRPVKNALEDVYKYVPEGFGLIRNGEVGKYENIRFIEQSNIAKAGTTNTDWAFFFGADTVAEAIAVPEEIRAKIPSDYGRSMGLAWYYLGGFGIVHTVAAQTRIVKWESKA